MRDAHRQTLEILQQQSDQELQTLRFELEDEGKAMLGESCAHINYSTTHQPTRLEPFMRSLKSCSIFIYTVIMTVNSHFHSCFYPKVTLSAFITLQIFLLKGTMIIAHGSLTAGV